PAGGVPPSRPRCTARRLPPGRVRRRAYAARDGGGRPAECPRGAACGGPVGLDADGQQRRRENRDRRGGDLRGGNGRLDDRRGDGRLEELDAIGGERELDFLTGLPDPPLDRCERDLERVGDLAV